MFAKIIEILTGRDDLERVAYRENVDELLTYLKTRRLVIPRRPSRFLDADSPEELLKLIEKEVEELATEPFEPWILEVDGKRRLPAFSSQKKLLEFHGKISQRLNKIFSLGSGEVLFEVVRNLDIDFVDLNLYSSKSWEIVLKKNIADCDCR